MQKVLQILCLVFSLAAIISQATSSNKSSEIDDIRNKFIELEKSLWKNLNIKKNDHVKKIFNNYHEFINNYLNIDFDDKLIFKFITHKKEWIKLKNLLLQIDELFLYFRRVLNKYHKGEYDEDIAVDFMETLITNISKTTMNNMKLSDKYLLGNIENIMEKIIVYYRGMLNGPEQLSVTNQSCQQYLFSIYNNITMTELKGYAMIQFSYMILKINSKGFKGNYNEKSTSIREYYETTTFNTQRILHNILLAADRIVWRSDPPVHIKYKTYDELQFLQGYIENEVDLNPDRSCKQSCGDYFDTKNNGCYEDNKLCGRTIKCKGKIIKCRYIDSKLQVCLSPPKNDSYRRYDYIETGSGRILGEKSDAARDPKRSCRKVQANSWGRGFYRCSYCFCFCDEIKSDRYFNLRETSSDVKANMIVTGLRFVKHNNIFQIQIQEGELLPKGKINLETVRWKPVDDYRYSDGKIKSGIDFYKLEWDKSDIDLDHTISEDPSHIVTGIRLQLIGNHLNFQIKFSEYNYETGKLINPLGENIWVYNENTENSEIKRKKIVIKNPDLPTKSKIKSTVISTWNEYIEFTNSDIDKDAAQSTVPFIDIQDVVSDPPVPLSGCGIYFKSRYEYGGFIAPKLITHDFISHIQWPKYN